MTWLRADDGFDTHRKMLALGDGIRGDARRWTWTRILLYTARYENSEVPANVGETIPRATRTFLRDCLEIGLLDEQGDGRLVVHDWPLYADIPIAEKVAYYLTFKKPGASANEVARAIGGKREIVLAEVTRYHHEQGKPGSNGTS